MKEKCDDGEQWPCLKNEASNFRLQILALQTEWQHQILNCWRLLLGSKCLEYVTVNGITSYSFVFLGFLTVPKNADLWQADHLDAFMSSAPVPDFMASAVVSFFYADVETEEMSFSFQQLRNFVSGRKFWLSQSFYMAFHKRSQNLYCSTKFYVCSSEHSTPIPKWKH
jgi:hypothetical protein